MNEDAWKMRLPRGGRMSFLWNFVYSAGLSSSCSLGKEWLIWLSSWGLQGPSLAPNSLSLETDDFRCIAQKVPLKFSASLHKHLWPVVLPGPWLDE